MSHTTGYSIKNFIHGTFAYCTQHFSFLLIKMFKWNSSNPGNHRIDIFYKRFAFFPKFRKKLFFSSFNDQMDSISTTARIPTLWWSASQLKCVCLWIQKFKWNRKSVVKIKGLRIHACIEYIYKYITENILFGKICSCFFF